jgi:hypothetical protein
MGQPTCFDIAEVIEWMEGLYVKPERESHRLVTTHQGGT